MTPRRALLLGATGLVGERLLDQLLADERYGEVRVLVRRPLARSHPKLSLEQVDFEQLAAHVEAFRVEHVFCCLGTTLRQAGSQSAFRRVDHDYVVEAARLAAAAASEHFLWISSLGADARSRVFYSRVKGELEEAVAALPLRRWTAVRPSLLLGARRESRPAEAAAIALTRRLGWLLRGRWAVYRPIEAEAVAAAMIALANDERPARPLQVVSG